MNYACGSATETAPSASSEDRPIPPPPVALAPLVSDGEREEIAAWSRGSASGDPDRTLAGLIDS